MDVEGEEGGDVDVEAIDGDELGGDGEEGTKEDEYTPKVLHTVLIILLFTELLFCRQRAITELL